MGCRGTSLVEQQSRNKIRAVKPAALIRTQTKSPDCLETNPGLNHKNRRSSKDATELPMKKISALAAVLLVSSAVAAYAQKTPGASEYSPGDRMKDQSSTMSGTKGPGASSHAPGHEQKNTWWCV